MVIMGMKGNDVTPDPETDRLKLWIDRVVSTLEESSLNIVWVRNDARKFRVSSPRSPRTANIRFIHDELMSTDLSNGMSVVRFEDFSNDGDFLEYADELVQIGMNYVVGNYLAGRGRGRLWIEIPFRTEEGHNCRERIYRNLGFLQRMFGSSGVIIDDDET